MNRFIYETKDPSTAMLLLYAQDLYGALQEMTEGLRMLVKHSDMPEELADALTNIRGCARGPWDDLP